MKGFLNDGPAAGQVVEVGDPPIRRGVIVLDAGGLEKMRTGSTCPDWIPVERCTRTGAGCLGIAETKLVGELTERQRELLADQLGQSAPVRPSYVVDGRTDSLQR
jgi:hypothetical protein